MLILFVVVFFFQVGPQAVQIQTTHTVKILGFQCVLNDVFYASEIERVNN